jgi:ubiquinone biosynthesis protein UbiJ
MARQGPFSPEWAAYIHTGFLGWVNAVIESRPEVHEACRALAGRRLCFVADPIGIETRTLQAFTAFEADGLLGSLSLDASLNHEPEVIIHLGPGFFVDAVSTGLAQLAAPFLPFGTADQGTSAAGPSLKGVRIEGDAALAQKLMPLIESLKNQRPEPPALLRFLTPKPQPASHDPEALPFVSKVELRQQVSQLRSLRESLDRLEKRLKTLQTSRTNLFSITR